ncbi:MAG: acyl-CoA dehydrogenase family protein [Acidocella sp.]|nr:acyl-CoA dehydrogenase family protein [Acidocella sp.]
MTVQTFSVETLTPPPDATALRNQVRAFITANIKRDDPRRLVNSWAVPDHDFTRALGEAGYIGMVLPTEYGGGGRSQTERYVVLEELLAAGAPVGLHWIADRQTGPLLLKYGTETQRKRYLPGIVQGKIFACIGLSEPGAGSDLSAVRMRADKVPGGWRLNGQKLWTTNAHHAHLMLALVRSERGSERHAGLSQYLIELATPGITIRPIIDLAGGHDFNEVFFEDVFVDEDALVGTEGQGWAQATAELTLERAGPERYISSLGVLLEFIRMAGPAPDAATASVIGKLTAELWTLRQMSMSVLAKLASGEDPALEATIVKDLGNLYEQEVVRAIQAATPSGFDLMGDSACAKMLSLLVQVAPSFSLRGGTREILRGIVAKGLGLR